MWKFFHTCKRILEQTVLNRKFNYNFFFRDLQKNPQSKKLFHTVNYQRLYAPYSPLYYSRPRFNSVYPFYSPLLCSVKCKLSPRLSTVRYRLLLIAVQPATSAMTVELRRWTWMSSKTDYDFTRACKVALRVFLINGM